MTYLSDPDRLERLAKYVQDEPPNTSVAEVATALLDAAARIRSLQERLEPFVRPMTDDRWRAFVKSLGLNPELDA